MGLSNLKKSLLEGNLNIFRRTEAKSAPEIGEFRVYDYDENDDSRLVTEIVFTTKTAVEEYIKNNCDPSRDPYYARRTERTKYRTDK